MIPSQKFGVEMPARAKPLAIQSAGRSRFTAESTPSGTPMATAMTKAMAPSWSVTGSFCRISSVTGCRMRQEKPRSPCSSRNSQARYCSQTGRSSISSARICASTSGSPRSSPAMIRAGSPGMSCCRPKTRRLRISSVGTTCPRRRSSQPNIARPYERVRSCTRISPSGWGLKPPTRLVWAAMFLMYQR